MSGDLKPKRRRVEPFSWRLISLFSACISLAGCVLFVPGVDDLRLVDVQSVKVGALDTLRTERPNLSPSDVVGKIMIATQVDIHEIREQSQLNIWYTLTICNTGATVPGWTDVYERGVSINPNPMIKNIQSIYRDKAASTGIMNPMSMISTSIPGRITMSRPGPGIPGNTRPTTSYANPKLCVSGCGAETCWAGVSCRTRSWCRAAK